MSRKRTAELLRGTLDVLLLKALTRGAMHGYAIARWLESQTDAMLQIEEGSLYPALHRLERQGLIEPEWGLSDNNRQAKFYAITPAGREYLVAETSGWLLFATTVTRVLQAG